MCSSMAGPGAAGGDPLARLAALDTVLAELSSDSRAVVADLSHDQLALLAQQAQRLQARCDALALAAVGEVDARGTFTLDGCLTPAAWVRWIRRDTPAAASKLVLAARAVRSGLLPTAEAALAAGDLGVQHVQVIADKVADADPGAVALIEPEAVVVALDADVAATAAVMRRFQHALDPDAADAAAVARYDRAGLTLTPTLDGSMALSGLADEGTGAVIATAIDTASPLLTGDDRTPARRRLDGLADICRAYLGGQGSDGTPRAQLVVTVDAATLDPAGQQPSPGGTLSWAGPITGATARRLGCDAHATFVAIGPDGEVVEAGTARRFFTPAQRRAMIGRDGDRCAAPYCDRPIAWADAHHLVPVEAHGPTTVANGVLICAAHHLLVHEGHWQLVRLPDGRYQLNDPATGRALGPEPHRPGHNRPPPRHAAAAGPP